MYALGMVDSLLADSALGMVDTVGSQCARHGRLCGQPCSVLGMVDSALAASVLGMVNSELAASVLGMVDSVLAASVLGMIDSVLAASVLLLGH